MEDSNHDLEILIGKAVSDPDFRQSLVNDPLQAIDEAGITLTPAQRDHLARYDRTELERLAQEVDQRISRSLIALDDGSCCANHATNGGCTNHSTGW